MQKAAEKGNLLFETFNEMTITELKERLLAATERAERIFLTRVLDVKLGLAQEIVVGEELF